MKHSSGFLKLVQSVMPEVHEIDIDKLKQMRQEGQDFILIDVREDHEWDKSHIPGAIHLGRGIIDRDIENQVPDHEATLVLYCGGGFRSALSASNLQKMGYKNVISLAGGYRAWQAADQSKP